MGMWSTLRDKLTARRHARDLGEADAPADLGVASSRATGGEGSSENDGGSTTGTGDSGEFVGRVSGQDVGYADKQGAEVGAEWAQREREKGEAGRG